MDKTGEEILLWMNWLAMLLPLIAVTVISLRQTWRQQTMHLLSLVCIVAAVQHFLSCIAPTFDPSPRVFLELVRWGLLVYIFRPLLTHRDTRNYFTAFFFSVVSAIATVQLMDHDNKYASVIAIFESAIMVVVVLRAFSRMMSPYPILILQLPEFWIGCGTLCYYSMQLLLAAWQWPMPQAGAAAVVSLFAELVTFSLYIVAALARRSPTQ